MPIEIPSRQDTTGALQAYVRAALPDLDPTVTGRRGFIGGLVKSLASALHDWYVKLKRYGDREPFPQTATGQFLTNGWWADITGLTRNAAAAAQGRVVITGTAGTILPAGATLEASGRAYTTDASAAVVAQWLILASLTRSGTTAIAETASDHYLASGMTVTIAGADQAEYNGSVVITVTADNEFTYAVSGSPASPATTATSLTVAGAWGNALITAEATGAETNLDAAQSLVIDSPPTGLDGVAIVTFGAIGGGTDLEDLEDYRERVLEALGTDFGLFSAAEIKIVAKQIAGVTRVWVREATLDGTNGVYEGQCKIYFVRDDDANIFPSSSESAEVRDHIFATILPAHTAEEDVTVSAPVRLEVDFGFSAITPDTPSMRAAIRAALEQFFLEAVDLGEDISEDAYRCAIFAAYDSERRQALKSFTLSVPVGTITVANDELPVLGEITFS